MFLEGPFEFLDGGRSPRPIASPRPNSVQQVLNLIKDLLAFVCDLFRSQLALFGMD